MRRNPGQAVNLAHLIWRRPCAPAPLPSNKGKSQTPGGFSSRGYGCFSHLSTPWGRGEKSSIWKVFAAGSAWAKAVFECGRARWGETHACALAYAS